ncbi:uncharacterized protein TNCV_2818961 [Trichonephila clavipes]|nr:uncharacterized protein TNCV_2818961 [Trichonephila clavipes]
MQDGTPPHIAHCVKQVLHHHFSDYIIISQYFPTAWPPRSPDLNPFDFWLRKYLKAMIFCDPITSLSDLKESIERHVHNIPQCMLLSTVKHTILRFQIVADNGGQHIEHVL